MRKSIVRYLEANFEYLVYSPFLLSVTSSWNLYGQMLSLLIFSVSSFVLLLGKLPQLSLPVIFLISEISFLYTDHSILMTFSLVSRLQNLLSPRILIIVFFFLKFPLVPSLSVSFKFFLCILSSLLNVWPSFFPVLKCEMLGSRFRALFEWAGLLPGVFHTVDGGQWASSAFL